MCCKGGVDLCKDMSDTDRASPHAIQAIRTHGCPELMFCCTNALTILAQSTANISKHIGIVTSGQVNSQITLAYLA